MLNSNLNDILVRLEISYLEGSKGNAVCQKEKIELSFLLISCLHFIRTYRTAHVDNNKYIIVYKYDILKYGNKLYVHLLTKIHFQGPHFCYEVTKMYISFHQNIFLD